LNKFPNSVIYFVMYWIPSAGWIENWSIGTLIIVSSFSQKNMISIYFSSSRQSGFLNCSKGTYNLFHDTKSNVPTAMWMIIVFSKIRIVHENIIFFFKDIFDLSKYKYFFRKWPYQLSVKIRITLWRVIIQ